MAADATDRAFRMVFTACARPQTCNDAYGDSGAAQTELVQAAQCHGPIILSRPNPKASGRVEIAG